MKSRKKISRRVSRKIFRQGAKVSKRNRPRTMRGGIRL